MARFQDMGLSSLPAGCLAGAISGNIIEFVNIITIIVIIINRRSRDADGYVKNSHTTGIVWQ